MAMNSISAKDLQAIVALLSPAPAPATDSDVLPFAVLQCLADLFPGAVAGVVELDGAGRSAVTGRYHASPGAPSNESLGVTFPAHNRAGPVHVYVSRAWPAFTVRDRVLFTLLAPRLEELVVELARRHDRRSLSPSELRVLELVARGASNAEVSAELSVSVATVRKHLEHIFLKLGVTNRTAAARVLGHRDAPPPVGARGDTR